MTSFFYVSGDLESRSYAEIVIDECSRFLESKQFKNKAWVVFQEVDGAVDVGLNLEGNGGDHFEDDARKVLGFLQELADRLGIEFVAGTDGEDRVYVDPNTKRDFVGAAEFLNAP